jgi:predicted permease
MRLGDGPGLRRNTRPLLRLLTAAVGLVLLIACANVASLLLARAVTRRREIAVRFAIGAARGQLIRQWLTESLLLGLLGASAALVVASWGIPILHGLGIPEGVDLNLNMRVLGATLIVGAATGLIFGLAPVLQIITPDAVAALRDEGGPVATGVRAMRARSTFVVVQVALTLVLLVAAGLLLRTLQHAYAVDLGYRIDRMLIATIDLRDRYNPITGQAFYAEVLNRINGLPGVAAAGAARVTVLSGAARTVPLSIDGRPLQPDRSNIIPVRANVVSEHYFDAMGIPVVRGRDFEATDTATAPRVAVVSRSLAQRLWPAADPIGRSLVSTFPLLVVGVVPDTVYRSALERDPMPVYYVPLSQNYEAAVSLHVRTHGDPMALLPAVRQIVAELDSRVPLVTPTRLEDEFSRSLIEHRTMVQFIGALSTIALVLAAVGLYAVLAYATRQRRTEIGLRLALGASPASILRMILWRGMRLVGLGAAFGLAGAFIALRVLERLLFGVERTDAMTWIVVLLLLVTVGLAACWFPARKAMRVDPAAALKSA